MFFSVKVHVFVEKPLNGLAVQTNLGLKCCAKFQRLMLCACPYKIAIKLNTVNQESPELGLGYQHCYVTQTSTDSTQRREKKRKRGKDKDKHENKAIKHNFLNKKNFTL